MDGHKWGKGTALGSPKAKKEDDEKPKKAATKPMVFFNNKMRQKDAEREARHMTASSSKSKQPDIRDLLLGTVKPKSPKARRASPPPSSSRSKPKPPASKHLPLPAEKPRPKPKLQAKPARQPIDLDSNTDEDMPTRRKGAHSLGSSSPNKSSGKKRTIDTRWEGKPFAACDAHMETVKTFVPHCDDCQEARRIDWQREKKSCRRLEQALREDLAEEVTDEEIDELADDDDLPSVASVLKPNGLVRGF